MSLYKMSRWALTAVAALCMLAPAQEDATPDEENTQQTTPKKKTPKNLKPVAAAIAAMDPFNSVPEFKAKYYIYLESASWCGPCCKEMPKIVELYPAMKKKKVEILLVGADRSPEAAEAYLQKFKAEFPGVWGGDPLVKDLPGYKRSNFVPACTIVDDKGKVITSGNASLIERWEEILFKKKGGNKKGKSGSR